MAVKDAYEGVRKQFGLPAFDVLDREFDLNCIEKEDNILAEVRQRLKDRLDFGVSVLGVIVEPDTNSVAEMVENSFFSELDKTNAWNLLKRLMVLKRLVTEASLLNDEKTDSDAIKRVAADWLGIKNELVVFVQKMRSSWEVQQSGEDEPRYLV